MSGQNYGSRRIQRTLHAKNSMIGRYKVRRMMRQQGLKTTWTRAFMRTTDSSHKMKVADNVLDQQYCSLRYQDLLTQHGIVCSMSHKGLCYDNAVIERFFLNLKMERIWQQHYATHQEEIKDISQYITLFYN